MIYLVEDDESIRELVVYTLKSQGMEAKGFERPSLFWKELEKEVPSLILLIIPRIRIKPFAHHKRYDPQAYRRDYEKQ